MGVAGGGGGARRVGLEITDRKLCVTAWRGVVGGERGWVRGCIRRRFGGYVRVC